MTLSKNVEPVRKECPASVKKVHKMSSKHLRIHDLNNPKALKCTVENCKKTFQTISQRSNHLSRVHTEPIECPSPGCKSVMKKYRLRSHAKLHHEELKVKKSRSLQNLKQHKDKKAKSDLEITNYILQENLKRTKNALPNCTVVLKKMRLTSELETTTVITNPTIIQSKDLVNPLPEISDVQDNKNRSAASHAIIFLQSCEDDDSLIDVVAPDSPNSKDKSSTKYPNQPECIDLDSEEESLSDEKYSESSTDNEIEQDEVQVVFQRLHINN